MKENKVTQRVYTDDNCESLNDSSLVTLSAMTKDDVSTANRKRSGLVANQSTIDAQADTRDQLSNVTNKVNEYTTLGSTEACPFIPGTTICPGPFQQFKMAIPGSIGTSPVITWAAIRPGPFQQFKMTILSSIGARPYIPWTLIVPSPFQHLKVNILRSTGTCAFIPSA